MQTFQHVVEVRTIDVIENPLVIGSVVRLWARHCVCSPIEVFIVRGHIKPAWGLLWNRSGRGSMGWE